MPSYSFFGWVSAISLGTLVLPFLMVRLNKYVLKTKNPHYFKLIKGLRKLHKPLGIIFGIVALTHGIMALGAFRLHTGWLLYFSVVLTVVTGGAFYRLKKKSIFIWHKLFTLAAVLLFLLHFFRPYAIWQIKRRQKSRRFFGTMEGNSG